MPFLPGGLAFVSSDILGHAALPLGSCVVPRGGGSSFSRRRQDLTRARRVELGPASGGRRPEHKGLFRGKLGNPKERGLLWKRPTTHPVVGCKSFFGGIKAEGAGALALKELPLIKPEQFAALCVTL